MHPVNKLVKCDIILKTHYVKLWVCLLQCIANLESHLPNNSFDTWFGLLEPHMEIELS